MCITWKRERFRFLSGFDGGTGGKEGVFTGFFAWVATVIHMTDANIYAFALVLLVAGNVALAWLTLSLRKDVSSLRGTASTFERRFVNIGIKLGELTKASPANLAAEVVSLGEAVARLRATHQRFQGRFDQYVSQGAGAQHDDEPDDPKWRALMQLQGNGKHEGT